MNYFLSLYDEEGLRVLFPDLTEEASIFDSRFRDYDIDYLNFFMSIDNIQQILGLFIASEWVRRPFLEIAFRDWQSKVKLD